MRLRPAVDQELRGMERLGNNPPTFWPINLRIDQELRLFLQWFANVSTGPHGINQESRLQQKQFNLLLNSPLNDSHRISKDSYKILKLKDSL